MPLVRGSKRGMVRGRGTTAKKIVTPPPVEDTAPEAVDTEDPVEEVDALNGDAEHEVDDNFGEDNEPYADAEEENFDEGNAQDVEVEEENFEEGNEQEGEIGEDEYYEDEEEEYIVEDEAVGDDFVDEEMHEQGEQVDAEVEGADDSTPIDAKPVTAVKTAAVKGGTLVKKPVPVKKPAVSTQAKTSASVAAKVPVATTASTQVKKTVTKSPVVKGVSKPAVNVAKKVVPAKKPAPSTVKDGDSEVTKATPKSDGKAAAPERRKYQAFFVPSLQEMKLEVLHMQKASEVVVGPITLDTLQLPSVILWMKRAKHLRLKVAKEGDADSTTGHMIMDMITADEAKACHEELVKETTFETVHCMVKDTKLPDVRNMTKLGDVQHPLLRNNPFNKDKPADRTLILIDIHEDVTYDTIKAAFPAAVEIVIPISMKTGERKGHAYVLFAKQTEVSGIATKPVEIGGKMVKTQTVDYMKPLPQLLKKVIPKEFTDRIKSGLLSKPSTEWPPNITGGNTLKAWVDNMRALMRLCFHYHKSEFTSDQEKADALAMGEKISTYLQQKHLSLSLLSEKKREFQRKRKANDNAGSGPPKKMRPGDTSSPASRGTGASRGARGAGPAPSRGAARGAPRGTAPARGAARGATRGAGRGAAPSDRGSGRGTARGGRGVGRGSTVRGGGPTARSAGYSSRAGFRGSARNGPNVYSSGSSARGSNYGTQRTQWEPSRQQNAYGVAPLDRVPPLGGFQDMGGYERPMKPAVPNAVNLLMGLSDMLKKNEQFDSGYGGAGDSYNSGGYDNRGSAQGGNSYGGASVGGGYSTYGVSGGGGNFADSFQGSGKGYGSGWSGPDNSYASGYSNEGGRYNQGSSGRRY